MAGRCVDVIGGVSAAESASEDFANFYSFYRPLVYSVALRLLRNASDAEDAVQTVFLKVLTHPSSNYRGNVERWLTTVTKNASIDQLRHSIRESPCASLPEGALRMFHAAPSLGRSSAVENEAIQAALSLYVTRRMSALPTEQRMLLIAAFVECQSHREIADESKLPLGTVKTRIRTGLLRLRKFCDGFE